MPPLISLETSALKYEALPRVSGDGRKAGFEFINTIRMDDSNVIQFCSPDTTALRESSEPEASSDPRLSYFRQLYENSPAAIVLLDTYDHVIDLNPAFTKIFQYTLDEIRNLPLTDFIVPKGHMREAIEMTLRTLRGEPVLQTIQRKRKDGMLVSVELTAFPIKLQGSRIGIYTIYTDVSQKKAMERRMSECERLSSLGIVAGSAAREINAVLGMLMAGIKQMAQGSSDARALQEMNAAIDRGVELVGRLLAFAGKADVHAEMPNADAMIQEVSLQLRSIVPHENVSSYLTSIR